MMASTRPTPFSMVFGDIAAARFPPIRSALEAAGLDPVDRDAFLLLREVNLLMQELRPEEGLGERVAALAALVQSAYLFWAEGEPVLSLDEPRLDRVLADGVPVTSPLGPGVAGYIQLPRLRVWGAPTPGGPQEPLDGWFSRRCGATLQVLAVFGLSSGREGFTVVEVRGERPTGLQRPDGSPLFSPGLAGGARAGLASVLGEEELLELAWRIEEQQ